MKPIQNGSLSKSADQQHNNDSSKQLVEKLQIPNTPFTAVKFDKLWYLTLGKYRLTEGLDTYDQVEDNAHDASWNRIMQIIQIMIDENKANNMQYIDTQHITKPGKDFIGTHNENK